MWIKTARIQNFKSIADSGVLKLARHMNVVVGQNNVGKTALLQAIAQRLSNSPHRSSSIRRGEPFNPIVRANFEFVATQQEVRDQLLSGGAWIPIPTAFKPNPIKILSRPEFTFSALVEAAPRSGWQQSVRPSYDVELGPSPSSAIFQPDPERREITVGQQSQIENDDFGLKMGLALTTRTYLFNALRAPPPRSAAGSNPQLAPDAGNLPEVLSTFQPVRKEYEKYIEEVRRVLPILKWINVVPNGNQSEIRVWNIEDASGRDDLANPLDQCGTGVGQVLAILYVVMRSSGDVICIDEPNSFLHPGAAKALLTILNEHREHQYIITTHSPEVISASQPDRLFMLRFEDEKTAIKEMDQADVESARQILIEIGSRLSDVFGADTVLWVEGPTEVECFPLLIRATGRQAPVGLAIAPLRSTGDLEGRHAKAYADIYRNLSTADSILPKSVGISLDGDKQGDARIESLEVVFGKIVSFLPRMMYESYLIHTRAVAALLNSLPTFLEKQVTDGQIEDWLRKNGKQKKYGAPSLEPFSSDWMGAVNAALLLNDLFEAISEAKEIYRKPSHSIWLTRWLLANDKAALTELTDYVLKLIGA